LRKTAEHLGDRWSEIATIGTADGLPFSRDYLYHMLSMGQPLSLRKKSRHPITGSFQRRPVWPWPASLFSVFAVKRAAMMAGLFHHMLSTGLPLSFSACLIC
jgi:hypothetical protein